MDFMHDPVRLTNKSQTSYERGSLENIWNKSNLYNEDPMKVDGKFDIRQLVPNRNLRRKAAKWIEAQRKNNNLDIIPAAGVILDYRRAVMKPEMEARLTHILEMIKVHQPSDGHKLEEITKAVRRLRLELGYGRTTGNQRRFLESDGPHAFALLLMWNYKRRPLPSAALTSEILWTYVDLHVRHGFNIGGFLRNHVEFIFPITKTLYEDHDDTPRGLRFDACRLLALAIDGWDFDHNHHLEVLLSWVAPVLVQRIEGDESLQYTLPALLHLSRNPSTRLALAISSETLMAKAADRIFQACAAERVRERVREDKRRYQEFVFFTLEIVLNLCADEEAARIAFVDTNSHIHYRVKQLVKVYVESHESDHILTEKHLFLALCILNCIYSHSGSVKVLNTYAEDLQRCLLRIMDTSFRAFPSYITDVAGKMLRHYMYLESYVPKIHAWERSIFNSVFPPENFPDELRSLSAYRFDEIRAVSQSREDLESSR